MQRKSGVRMESTRSWLAFKIVNQCSYCYAKVPSEKSLMTLSLLFVLSDSQGRDIMIRRKQCQFLFLWFQFGYYSWSRVLNHSTNILLTIHGPSWVLVTTVIALLDLWTASLHKFSPTGFYLLLLQIGLPVLWIMTLEKILLVLFLPKKNNTVIPTNRD